MIVPESHILADSETRSPALATNDRHKVLVEWNQTQAPYPRNACLHHRFETQAGATPHATALVVDRERLTYRELNSRANRVAHRLRSQGVGPEILVGIFLKRSVDLVCALLGVLKAGGAYVPMDPAYPPDRLAFMMQDARVHTVLTQTSLATTLLTLTTADGAPTPAIACVDTNGHELPAAWAENPPATATASNLAYVIYTSGSTGRPKGVALEHRNAVAFVHWAGSLYSPRELSGVLAGTSICFDPSILELFVPLSFGGTVILAENALALPNLPAAGEIHLMDTVPSAIRELLRVGGLPTSLETINLGGEPVSDDLVRQLYALPHIRRVYDQYGPTEATTSATCSLRNREGVGNIGRPIANTQVYLLNDEREPVALGATGELYIGGAGVARGYLNRPELTAEKFIENPFSDEPGARLYRTGDLCRHQPDGTLEYVGRVDQQIKINGHRIELGEIESVLRAHPSVNEAVVIVREDRPGQRRMTAYVVSKHASSETQSEPELIAELRAHLRNRLPSYMVPASFSVLAEFKTTASGKIDRKTLPAPSLDRIEENLGHQASRSATEESILKIWSQLLGLKTIGVHDNFFDIGGDSLSGVEMLVEVGQLKGTLLPLDTVIKAPTIAKLAVLIDTRDLPEKGRSSLIGVRTEGKLPPLFLVHGIGGGMLWGYANLSRHLGPNQPVYAFSAPELETNQPSPSVAGMAERYVDELRRFQPDGPYLLGGYCFGGNIAYEMARLLHARGQTVSLLALFNSWPTNSSYDHFRWTPVQIFKFVQNLCLWLRRFIDWGSGTRRNFIRWKLGALKQKLSALLHIPASPGMSSRDADVDVAGMREAQKRLWREHTRAITEHRTGPYEGSVELFRTRGHPLFCSFDYCCGWGELARGGVTVRILPGHHETLMTEPHVGLLAMALKSDLESLPPRPGALVLTLILTVSAFFEAGQRRMNSSDEALPIGNPRAPEAEIVAYEKHLGATRRTPCGRIIWN